jgi:hypothetical protein
MTTKTKNIINWALAGIVGIIFAGSAANKFFGGEEVLKMAESIGLSASAFKSIGFIEIASLLLFLFPRTGVLGTFMLMAYMGGAIVAHLTHGQSIMGPVVISAILWIVAVIRFPELRSRLLGTGK